MNTPATESRCAIIQDAIDWYCEPGTDRFSFDGEGACYYRGPEGNLCVVGRYIPDNSYRLCLEGKPVREIINIDRVPLPFADDIDFWMDMQTAHDSIEGSPTPHESFRCVAEGLLSRYAGT